tara:strand:- start:310 stop:504 length:195 start_codon:yes stop_codon:yes gene_type:complete
MRFVFCHYFFLLVDALIFLKIPLAGAPLLPAFLIVSPEPDFIRRFFAAMFAYKPGFFAISLSFF